jgi:hypothetical protein
MRIDLDDNNVGSVVLLVDAAFILNRVPAAL